MCEVKLQQEQVLCSNHASSFYFFLFPTKIFSFPTTYPPPISKKKKKNTCVASSNTFPKRCMPVPRTPFCPTFAVGAGRSFGQSFSFGSRFSFLHHPGFSRQQTSPTVQVFHPCSTAPSIVLGLQARQQLYFTADPLFFSVLNSPSNKPEEVLVFCFYLLTSSYKNRQADGPICTKENAKCSNKYNRLIVKYRKDDEGVPLKVKKLLFLNPARLERLDLIDNGVITISKY